MCVTCRKARTSTASRGVRLLQTYGIDLDDYEAMLAAQGGGCAICGRKPRYNLDVDHDHATGMVRGLLCKLDNRRLLPAARDSVETLEAAIQYLKYPPAIYALAGPHYVPEAKA